MSAQAGNLAMIGQLIRGPGAGERTGVRGSLRLVNAAWLTIIASIGLSLLSVYAIDVAETVRPEGVADLAPTAWKQAVFAIVGMLAATVVALPHYRIISVFSWPLMGAMIALLVFLLVPFVPASIVTPRNGTRAWIDLGPADFQPSEITKIAFVLVVAQYLRYRTKHRQFTGLIVPGLIAAVPLGLITLQPDLGTAMLFVPALFAMLIAAGAKLRHLSIIVVCAALAAPAAYPFLKPHQKTRIVAMLKAIEGDTTTAQDINYQAYTAQRLIGAGQFDGSPAPAARALVYYNRLPERHNDMVYAVIVARFGLWGGLGVIALYLVWIGGALLVAASCKEPIGRLIAVGIPAFIAAQMVINVGMNLGLVPIIGITLPFVSYGGSSLLASWLMAGLIANVALHKPRPPFRQSFEYPEDDERPRLGSGKYGRAVGFSGRAITR
ncbi:MAG: FtsW/RodA/SpoVE family cell cycle protein [Phycisphaerales bacterium]